MVFNTRIVSNCCLECCVQRVHQFRSREDKKALNLGFIFRPQTRYILEIYLDSFVPKYFQLKINGQMKLTSNASPGAHTRWKSRELLAIVSLSFGVEEHQLIAE